MVNQLAIVRVELSGETLDLGAEGRAAALGEAAGLADAAMLGARVGPGVGAAYAAAGAMMLNTRNPTATRTDRRMCSA